MCKKWFVAIICLLVVLTICVSTCLGSDLDDGISKYTDDNISKADEIGKLDINISFIILDAMAKSKKNRKDDENGKNGKASKGGASGDIYENSIIIGPGAVITGDIINIVRSK